MPALHRSSGPSPHHYFLDVLRAFALPIRELHRRRPGYR